uniref:AlNc14C15G1674 protein n=1 Tax=Albugo laibachii Nc14 TaxID=890382 RepID=F0W3X3_9STRA|nr:AlNc14C15G1674 [Albugo laibachii Nc14]|eukprot:CCA15768.1 AlNc14C15G1674 [Albugo laibachii Nc14]
MHSALKRGWKMQRVFRSAIVPRRLLSSENTLDHTNAQTFVLVMLEQEKRLLKIIDDETYIFFCPMNKTSIGVLVEQSLDTLHQPLSQFRSSRHDLYTEYHVKERKRKIQTSRSSAEGAVLDMQELLITTNLDKIAEESIDLASLFNQREKVEMSSLSRDISSALHRCIDINGRIKKIIETHYPRFLQELPPDFGHFTSKADSHVLDEGLFTNQSAEHLSK